MKAIIYLRTSTEEQNPLNQLESCKSKANNLNILDYDIITEQQSAFKDYNRQGFDKVKQLIQNKQVNILICWDLDRLYRNRKKLIEFFQFCKIYNCKVYSVRQDWLESLNKIQEPFNEIMFDLMLQIMGWLAEEESLKKSERVKNAVRKDKDNKTISYKGNKWGRKCLSKNTIKQVLELHNQGLSMRAISKQVFYWDRNNNKKKIALTSVHKIITQNKE